MENRDLTINEILSLDKFKDVDINKILAGSKKAKKKNPCSRCKGTGVVTQYLHHHNGKCFICKGKGYTR